MKNQYKILTLLAMFLVSGMTSSLYSQAGGSAVPFLLISPDSRAGGMGETGTAVADDINAIYWNPGGLAFLDYFDDGLEFSDEDEDLVPYVQASLAFSEWLPQFNADLFYSYGTFGKYFESLDGTVAFNLIYMNLGKFTKTSDSGQDLGEFLSNEFSIGASYGTIIADDLGFGVQLKYIQSNLTPTSNSTSESGTGVSVGVDIGILWKPLDLNIAGLDLEDRFSLGLNLQNMGPKMTYLQESDPLPTTIRFGVAYALVNDPYNKVLFALDIAKLLVNRDENGSDPLPKSLVTGWENPGQELSFGLEWWYQNVIAFRGGYFTEPQSLGNRQFYTFGVGVKYESLTADFSFINPVEDNHPLANTMRFTFKWDFMN